MHSIPKPAVFFFLTLGIAVSAFPQTQAASRITQAIDDRNTTQLQGNVHAFLQHYTDQGRLDGGTKLQGVSLIFKRTAAQDAAIEKLLAEQQDLASANYHEWLTPEEYADRFGLGTKDVAKVVAWLQSEGFTVDRVARGRTEVFFTGTVSQIETVFRTEMHSYLVKGEQHYANSVEPAVPASLVGVVAGLQHLDNFVPKSHVKMLKDQWRDNFSFGGQLVVAPADFKTIYHVPSSLTGSGQNIVIVGQSDLFTTGSGASTAYPDIDAFRVAFGLPARTSANFATPILVGTTNPGVVSGDVDESNLDLEWSAALAPAAKVIFIFAGSSGNGAFGAIQYAIDNNSAPIISSSYGLCELDFTTTQIAQLVTFGQQANTQGQTVVAAAGDTGPADCDSAPLPAQGGLSIDLPGGLPYVTSVGGTEFSGDASSSSPYWSTGGAAQSYIPETTWNDTVALNQLDATGGGLSTFFSKPDWQSATGVPNDGARDVPDIALNASNTHDPYVLYTGASAGPPSTPSTLHLAGGTSFGAPTFAGIVALLNQQVGGAQGNVNPTLYKLNGTTPTAFHDVTTGNNIVPCQVGTPNCPSSGSYGYSAGTGYDLVTGLGSLEVTNLVNAWTGANPTAADFHLHAVQASISAPGGTGTSTITVDGVHGFSGAVTLACAAPTSALISCSINPTSVTPTGASNTATATLTINTTAAGLNFHSAPLWFNGSGAMLAGVFAFGLATRRRRLKAAAALAVVAFLLASVGCGGSSSGNKGGSGTPAGTYVVSVTATSGSTSHTTNVSVKVI